MKNILIPFNFILQDEYALDLAAKIAKQSNADLYVLTFEESLEPAEWIGQEQKSNIISVENSAAKKIENYLSQLPFFNELHLKHASLAEFEIAPINNLIITLEIDLVITGTHKKTGVNEILFGSITEKLVRNISCPIITVNEKFKKEKITTIVFASNFEEDIKLPFSKIFHIANTLDANIHLLYVNTPEDFKDTTYMKETMEYFCEDYKSDSFTQNIYNAHLKEEGIINFAGEINADLVALISHEKTSFSLLSSSLTERLINKSCLPILSVSII